MSVRCAEVDDELRTDDTITSTGEGYPNKRARTRQALIEGAMDVIGRRGPEHLTASAVSTAAGVSHGTFYNHVEGIDDLLGLVVDQLAAPFELIGDDRAGDGGVGVTDPADRVATAVSSLLRLAVRDRVRARALVVAVAVRADLRARLRAVVRPTISEGITAGVFDADDDVVATEALIGATQQLLRAAVHDGVTLDEDAAVDTCLQLLGARDDHRCRAPVDTADTATDTLVG